MVTTCGAAVGLKAAVPVATCLEVIVVEFLVGIEEGSLVVELVVRWCDDEGGGLKVVVG